MLFLLLLLKGSLPLLSLFIINSSIGTKVQPQRAKIVFAKLIASMNL